MDNKFEDNDGYSRGTVPELRSEAVLRLGVFKEVDGSSILFCKTKVVCLYQNEVVKSDNFQCSKSSDFQARA